MSGRKKTSGAKMAVAATLPVIDANVAGIDVGSKQHVVCGPARPNGLPNVATFGSTTAELLQLAEWLENEGVTSVAMESTSIYWIPLYELLDSRGIPVLLANARQLHNVPGRKTDFLDCQWIQLLHSRGLLRGSFRPPDAVVRMRTLHRQMANLVAERSRCVQWIQKSLDQMNVQVHRAVTDLTGTTGMAIVRAIIAGVRDPLLLAQHRDPRCGKSLEEIAEHLVGHWRDEHLFNLQQAVRLFDEVEKSIAEYEGELLRQLQAVHPPERRTEPVPRHPNSTKEKAIRRRGEQNARTELWRFAGVDLTRIDGISAGTAQTILTEVGPNLSAFPSEKHFVSWLRLCPRTAVSGGKPLKKRRNSRGASRIACALRMCATSLQHSHTALGAVFRRTARMRGATIAIFATARRLAQFVYRMLVHGHDYTDIGEEAYEQQVNSRRLLGLKAAAQALGYTLQSIGT
jgi:transposase